MGDGVIKICVDFSKSRSERTAALGRSVPQFFGSRMSPLDDANAYMRLRAKGLAVKSLMTEADHLNEFLKWQHGSAVNLEDIDDGMFESYVDALCVYTKPDGQPLSWNTVNSRVSGAYRFLKWAEGKRLCPDLNSGDLDIVKSRARFKFKSKGHVSKPTKELVNFLLIDDALKFVNALGDVSGTKSAFVRNRNRLIGLLQLQTGMRVSEVCRFPLKDLPEVNPNGHSTPARVLGKGNKRRAVLIPNELLLRLWEHVDLDRELVVENVPMLAGESVSEKLFITTKGRSISINWIQKLFRKCSEYCGITANPHMLRHTFGTYHYLLNRDLTGLSKLMGHESEETTRSYYLHLATLASYSGTFAGLNEKIDSIIGG